MQTTHPRRSGDVTQQAECRIVYPVVAGSNPAVLASLYIAAAPRPVLYTYKLIRAGGGGCSIYPDQVKRDGAVSLDNCAAGREGDCRVIVSQKNFGILGNRIKVGVDFGR
jgi:hypothetical protein